MMTIKLQRIMYCGFVASIVIIDGFQTSAMAVN